MSNDFKITGSKINVITKSEKKQAKKVSENNEISHNENMGKESTKELELLNIGTSIIETLPDIDKEKVNQLREQYNDENFQVNLESVVEQMLGYKKR